MVPRLGEKAKIPRRRGIYLSQNNHLSTQLYWVTDGATCTCPTTPVAKGQGLDFTVNITAF